MNRKITIKTGAFFAAFAMLGISCIFAEEQVSSEKAPQTVTFCDMVQDPDHYDQAVVRVTAIIMEGPESSLLYQSTCIDRKYLTWFEWDAYSRALKSADRKVRDQLLHGIRAKKRVEITTVGRFESKHHDVKVPANVDPEKGEIIKRVNESMGFGHLNLYRFQFVPFSIEAVRKVPDSVQWP